MGKTDKNKHIENNYTLLEQISEFSKVAGYKNYKSKSIAFLYTQNEHVEMEIKNTVPFTIASRKMKYLGLNVTKQI